MVYFIHWGGPRPPLQLAIPIVTIFFFLVTGLMGCIRVKNTSSRVGPPEKALEQGKENPEGARVKA